MTTGNIIYVQHKHGYFHVWEQGIEALVDYNGGNRHRSFNGREGAEAYAKELQRDMYANYGIVEVVKD